MGTRLYVGNLPFSTTSMDLETLFSEHGTVMDAQVMTDRETGRSRGFGFVEMESDEGAEQAIAELNDSEVSGRRIRVNVARERTNR